MSTAAAPMRDPLDAAQQRRTSAASASACETHPERPALYVVRGIAPARSTLPFLFLLAMIVAGSLVASMLLNASMADTAFKMQKAQVELNVVNDHIDTLHTQVQEASSAGSLAKRAAQLGMVPAGAPGVVDLNSGAVAGGQAAKADKKSTAGSAE